jgi:hypothetical protein
MTGTTRTQSPVIRGRRTTAGAAAAVAVVMALAASPAAQSANSASPSGLVGTWRVQVTLRDCATDAQIGLPFQSLVTFHRGGTVTESTTAPAFAIGQRSAGHGTWAHLGGGTYLQKMIALIAFDTAPNLPFSPGFAAGWQTVTHTVEQIAHDQLVSFGTSTFYTSNGAAYRTGCSSAVGRRFE